MTLLELADNIQRNIDSSITQAAILLWLRSKVGDLNAYTNTGYSIDNLGEINPLLDLNDAAIFEALYKIYFYDKKLRETLGAAGVEQVLEVTQDGHTMRLLNKNEVSKTYLQAKKDAVAEFDSLVNNYKFNKSSSPLAVHGDDTVEGNYSVESIWRAE